MLSFGDSRTSESRYLFGTSIVSFAFLICAMNIDSTNIDAVGFREYVWLSIADLIGIVIGSVLAIICFASVIYFYENTLPEILKNSETVLLSHSIWNDKILVRMVAKDAYDLKSIQKNLISILADDNIPKVWNS